MVQLLYPYMTTGKIIALTIWTFVSKMMSLLFNTLSRFVTAFLPRIKHLLISWMQSPFTVILEPKKICHSFHFFPPSICQDVMGLDAIMFIMLSSLMLSFKSIQIKSEYAFYPRACRTFCMMTMYYVTKQTSTDLRGRK